MIDKIDYLKLTAIINEHLATDTDNAIRINAGIDTFADGWRYAIDSIKADIDRIMDNEVHVFSPGKDKDFCRLCGQYFTSSVHQKY